MVGRKGKGARGVQVVLCVCWWMVIETCWGMMVGVVRWVSRVWYVGVAGAPVYVLWVGEGGGGVCGMR